MGQQDMFEVASFPQKRADGAITATSFDPNFELFTAGSIEGGIQSTLYPTLEPYAVWRSHVKPVLGIHCTPHGSFSASADSLQLRAHGGMPLLSYREPLADIRCFDSEKSFNGSNHFLLGHSSGCISIFDLSVAQITSKAESSHGIELLRSNGRLIACGTSTGELSLWDARTMKQESTVLDRQGVITGLEIKNELLAICSAFVRMGMLTCHPVVKVFDVRQSSRALAHVAFPHGPAMLKFLPKFSSLLLMAANDGAVQITDVQGEGVGYKNFQIDCEGDALLCCDVSSSGEMFCFGDSGGYVHLWTNKETCCINLSSSPLEVVDPQPPLPLRPLSENDPPSMAYKPFIGDETLLSSVDPNMAISVGLPPRIIDATLLSGMKQMEFVSYVANPFWKRGMTYSEAMTLTYDLRNARQKKITDGRKIVQKRDRPEITSLDSSLRLPRAYTRVEIKLSQTAKFEEFDFSYYNKTHFAGFENDVLNSYVNPLLQVLYFIPELKSAVTKHVCEKEFCLTCELGFALHMLGLAEGTTCQPSNLVRTLCQTREAVALGLVEGPEDWESGQSNKEKLLAKRIQNLSRFMLEVLHKEAGLAQFVTPDAESSIADRLFGSSVQTIHKCLKASHEESSYMRRSFQVDLQYPSSSDPLQPSFSSILQDSLMKQDEMRAWCQTCKAYQPVLQTRLPLSLPHTLLVNCCINGDSDLQVWHSASTQPWLPHQITVLLSESGVKVRESSSPSEGLPSSLPGAQGESYQLSAVIAHVYAVTDDVGSDDNDDREPYEGHLVAHIKIPASYVEGGPSGGPSGDPVAPSTPLPLTELGLPAGISTPHARLKAGDWVLFNDFCITPTTEQEAVTFYGHLKVPCLLLYTRVDAVRGEETHPCLDVSPVSDQLFRQLTVDAGRDSKQDLHPSFWPLEIPREQPRKGMRFGIDAEFVALSAAQTATRADGSEYVKRPARLGLARVSVVRGEGRNAGLCCIDDYIRAVEPIYDYLTRYSGISPGDLDAASSRHHLTTVKKTYIKLRYLIDLGCVFVGHGLKKDFRMINIVVPQEQVIDTVELFHLKRHRKLSLRFLASYFLNIDIQKETHDSIEDARTALRLYEKYSELMSAGEFEQKLQEVYQHGRRHGWEGASSQVKM